MYVDYVVLVLKTGNIIALQFVHRREEEDGGEINEEERNEAKIARPSTPVLGGVRRGPKCDKRVGSGHKRQRARGH